MARKREEITGNEELSPAPVEIHHFGKNFNIVLFTDVMGARMEITPTGIYSAAKMKKIISEPDGDSILYGIHHAISMLVIKANQGGDGSQIMAADGETGASAEAQQLNVKTSANAGMRESFAQRVCTEENQAVVEQVAGSGEAAESKPAQPEPPAHGDGKKQASETSVERNRRIFLEKNRHMFYQGEDD